MLPNWAVEFGGVCKSQRWYRTTELADCDHNPIKKKKQIQTQYFKLWIDLARWIFGLTPLNQGNCFYCTIVIGKIWPTERDSGKQGYRSNLFILVIEILSALCSLNLDIRERKHCLLYSMRKLADWMICPELYFLKDLRTELDCPSLSVSTTGHCSLWNGFWNHYYTDWKPNYWKHILPVNHRLWLGTLSSRCLKSFTI